MENFMKIVSAYWLIFKAKMSGLLSPYIVALLAMLSPISSLVHIVLFSVLLDTIMGVYSSIKLNGWKSIRSAKLFNMVSKISLYSLSIILLFFYR